MIQNAQISRPVKTAVRRYHDRPVPRSKGSPQANPIAANTIMMPRMTFLVLSDSISTV